MLSRPLQQKKPADLCTLTPLCQSAVRHYTLFELLPASLFVSEEPPPPTTTPPKSLPRRTSKVSGFILSSMESKLSMGCSNPNPPAKMASHFVRSLLRVYHSPLAGASSFAGRSRRIKRAAYASIAYSAGARRAWSRALLRKLRTRPRPLPRQSPPSVLALPRRMSTTVSRTTPLPRRREADRAVAVLRKLVPGGAGMEYCSLLEEAADYVRCLAAQVQLMKTVVDSMAD